MRVHEPRQLVPNNTTRCCCGRLKVPESNFCPQHQRRRLREYKVSHNERSRQEVTVTQETDARTALEAKREKANSSIPGLEKDVAKAIEGIAAVPKGSQPQVYVDASSALGTAQALLEGAQGDIKRAAKGLDALVKLEKREAVVGALSPIASAFAPAAKALPKGCKASGIVPPAMYAKHADELAKAEVKSVGFTLDATVDGPPIASVKPSGATPRAPSAGGGGGGGGRYVNVSPDGSQRLSDREFVALVGPDHIGDDKTEHALTATGGTLYVTATSLRGKAGWTREQK